MNISLPLVLTGAAGALLILAAVKNQSPATIIKDALNGKVTDGKPSSYFPGLGRPGEDPYDPDGGLGAPVTEAPQGSGPIGLPPIPGAPSTYKDPLPRNYKIVSP